MSKKLWGVFLTAALLLGGVAWGSGGVITYTPDVKAIEFDPDPTDAHVGCAAATHPYGTIFVAFDTRRSCMCALIFAGEGSWFCESYGAGAGAPTSSTYVTTTSDFTLTGEFALGDLGTGLMINTTVAGTGTPSIYAGVQAQANKWISALDASGAGTRTQPAFTDISGVATNAQTTAVATSTASTIVARDANKDFAAGIITASQFVSDATTANGSRVVQFVENTVPLNDTLPAGNDELGGVGAAGKGWPYWRNVDGIFPMAASSGHTTDGPVAWADNGTSCATACTRLLGGSGACGQYVPMDGTNTAVANCTDVAGFKVCACH